MNDKKKLFLYFKISIPFIIVAGLYIFYRFKKQDFLHTGLQKMIVNKTDSLYRISYDSISVNEAKGDLYIQNLYIKGDTAKQMDLIRSGDPSASKVIVSIFIPLLKVVGFKTARALLSKKLECTEVIIYDAKATIYLFPGQAQHRDEATQQQELYKQILGNLKLIQADSVLINCTEVVAKDYFTNQIKFSSHSTTIALRDVLIDSTYRQDSSRTLFCKAIKLNANKVVLGERNNTAQITGLTSNTTSKIVLISRFDYDAFKNNGFFKTRLENILIEGIEWKGPAERSELSIKNIVLKNGDIETLTGDGNKKNSKLKVNDKILNGWIKSFSLQQLKIQSFALTSRTYNKKKQPVVITNNELLLKGVLLDSTSRLNESLVNSIGEAEFKNDNLTIMSDDKFYAYKMAGLRLNTKTEKVWIRQLACVPQYNEAEFARRSKFQTDRYDVSINNIECSNVDIGKLFKGEFYSSAIVTRSSSVKVYRDLSYPSMGENNLGAYPQQLLFKLKFPVKISSFTGYNNYIAYKEKNSLSDSSGTVTFNNSNISISNISNLPPKAGDKATLKFTSNLLGALPLKGSFIFNLDEWQKGTFQINASIERSFEAAIFNQLTQPMSLIKINSGVFDKISFSVVADNYEAKGKLTMPYHDFKISLLKKKGDEIHKKNALSILANAFIKNKNTADANMRVATINTQRNLKRSFFNFIWVSIFSGGQKILGVPIKK